MAMVSDRRRELTARDRVITAMRRRVPDRVPRFLKLCPAQTVRLKETAGHEDAEAYFKLDVRVVDPGPVRERPDVGRYLPDLPPGATIDEWGVAWTASSFYHFLGMVHPLARPMHRLRAEGSMAGQWWFSERRRVEVG